MDTYSTRIRLADGGASNSNFKPVPNGSSATFTTFKRRALEVPEEMGVYDKNLGALLLCAFCTNHGASPPWFMCSQWIIVLAGSKHISLWPCKLPFNDPLYIRAIVLFLFFVDTGHTASLMYMGWAYMVENFNNPAFIEKFAWPFPASTFVITTVAWVVQNFLAYRIYLLTRRKWVMYMFALWSTGTVALGFACAVQSTLLKDLSEVRDRSIRTQLTVWLGMAAAIDVCIASTLFTVLQRSRTGFKSSDAALNRLARSAVQAGVFTTILAVVSLVLFSASEDNLFYTTVGVPCARAYVISMMDNLLCRKDVRALIYDATWTFAVQQSSTTNGAAGGTLHVHREVHTEMSVVRFDVEPTLSRISESRVEGDVVETLDVEGKSIHI
ncbi:hypothetical protein NMY22_g11699 [Coprinellus aureogranulatus]|nr:hypothetical protein NMY22_g11699 [Coprinellus aureogranulatus]